MGNRITAVEVNRHFVVTKCDYFTDIQLWPLRNKLNPERWLSNFQEEELPYAVQLLNSFLYFNQFMMDRLLYAAFQRLSALIGPKTLSLTLAREVWKNFYDQVLITRVVGEQASDTDSGFHFQRMARQVLGIDESRILGPQEVMKELLLRPKPVVFLDDFVGSGEQFIQTWTREVLVSSRSAMSFKKLLQVVAGSKFFYCPLLCTDYGKGRIHAECPGVSISPAHFMPAQYSALSPDSIIWPPRYREEGIEFIRRASLRAGISNDEWKGFHGLGLLLAFEHSVPDATLPFFFWKSNGWKPLIERN